MSKTILFYDTETSGLPKKRNAPPNQHELWPYMLQYASMLVEADMVNGELQTTVVSRDMAYVQPFQDDVQRFTIDPGAAKANGLTIDFLKERGIPVDKVINTAMDNISRCDIIVAHNIQFDRNVLLAEAFRHGTVVGSVLSAEFLKRRSICTMLHGTHYCKIPMKRPQAGKAYKWPKLSELYGTLFAETADVEHEAVEDTETLSKCFFEMVKRDIITGVF